jgi:hypothetical protein
MVHATGGGEGDAMLSLATIQRLARQQARRAAQEHSVPLLVEAEDKGSGDRLARHLRYIPNLGTYRPRGWRLARRLFVDKTGIGHRDEPALTFVQFLAETHVGFGYAIIEEGVFQCYVGEFQPLALRRGCTGQAR